jgi:ubiquinone/menaquinone biosynthesis C-methylase UbiE
MPAVNGIDNGTTIDCEYFFDNRCVYISLITIVFGVPLRDGECMNSQKDACCYTCRYRPACAISCDLLETKYPVTPVQIVRSRPARKNEVKKILESTAKYYDAWAQEYERFYEDFVPKKSEANYKEGYEKVEQILSGIAEPGQLIADIGCGIGKWSMLLAQRNAYVVGLDLSRASLQKCRFRLFENNLKSRVFPILGNWYSLPLRDESFDGVTLNWVVSHIPYTKNEEVFREIARITKVNGWLVVSDSYWRKQEGGQEQIQTRCVDGIGYEVYKYYYSPSELKQLVEKTFGKVHYIFTTSYEQICISHRTRLF